MYKYTVEKYSGKVYCGNAFCETLDECYKFGNDGFCDKLIIYDTEQNTKLTIKIKAQ